MKNIETSSGALEYLAIVIQDVDIHGKENIERQLRTLQMSRVEDRRLSRYGVNDWENMVKYIWRKVS